MSDKCAVHDVIQDELDRRFSQVELKQETIFSKLDDIQKSITAIFGKLLVSIIVVLGGAATAMIVFIAIELGKKP